MIGRGNDQIVTGYETYEFKCGDWKVEEAVKKFKKQALNALAKIRANEREAKKRVELDKNQFMEGGADSREKHDYLFHRYVPDLRSVGLSLEKAKRAIQDSLKELKETVDTEDEMDSGKKFWAVQVWDAKSRTWLYVLCLYLGDAGYEQVHVDGIEREVWRKKLSSLVPEEFKGEKTNQYVKDDRGIFTRRYAYAAKSLDDCEELYKTKELTGRFQRNRLGSWETVTPQVRRSFPALAGPTMSIEQMLLVHQELGSGDNQRGMCLSSTDKQLHANSGGSFLNDRSVVIRVDLALIPIPENMLYNLYSQEAQKRTIGMERHREVRDPAPRSEIYSAAEQKGHTDASTAKNRELFLLTLRWDYVENKKQVEDELLRAGRIKSSVKDDEGFSTQGSHHRSTRKRPI